MGRRGPPPTPTAIRKLRGNPGKRALNKAEPVPPPGPTDAPAWLDGKALAMWERISPILRQMRVLDTSDTDALALLCDAYADYLAARDFVKKHGRTYTVSIQKGEELDAESGLMTPVWELRYRVRPEVIIKQEAWKRIRAMMQEFGMTPSARSRVTAKAAVDEDPVEAWMQSARTA